MKNTMKTETENERKVGINAVELLIKSKYNKPESINQDLRVKGEKNKVKRKKIKIKKKTPGGTLDKKPERWKFFILNKSFSFGSFKNNELLPQLFVSIIKWFFSLE